MFAPIAAIHYLRDRNPVDQEKSFFAYLPFSAPHWPLQCSEEDRNKYRGMYDEGPEALRLKRLARLEELGLIPKGVQAHDVVVADHNKGWNAMTNYERQCSARAMECFAGMVDNMDQNVGKMVDYLKQTGQFENTVIIFQSDNGAEGAEYEARDTMGSDLGLSNTALDFIHTTCAFSQASQPPLGSAEMHLAWQSFC